MPAVPLPSCSPFPLRLLAVAVALACARSAHAADVETTTTEMPTIQVQAVADPLAGAGSSATRLDTPLRDVPQAVQLVDQALIRAQGALEMKDVLRNVSGVALAQGEGRRDQFYLRGFDATRDTLVDGMRDDSLYFRDLGNVERIEVLKGPAAALYGRGSAGGVINRITKKPLRTPLREVGVTLGEDRLRRLDLDLAGALGKQGAFRLTGAREAGDSYRDVVRSERSTIAPSLSWALGQDTSVLVQAEWLTQRRTPDRGIPSVQGAPADVPAGAFYGEAYDYANTRARNARVVVEHAAGPALTLRNQFQYSHVTLDALNTRTLGLTADQAQVRRQVTYFPQQQSNYLNQLEAVLTLGGATLQHTVLAGVELGHQTADRRVRAAAAVPVALGAPVHTAALPALESLPLTIDQAFDADTSAFYLQDQASWGAHWKALAGVRFDRFKQTQEQHLSASTQARTDSVWSPRVGVVYQPNAAHALYVNLSRSFQPVGSDLYYGSADMAAIKPLEALQQELGAKSQWLQGRLWSTFSLFRITQRNAITRDPSDPAGLRQVQTGEQESRGVEADLGGVIQPGWKVFANYAYSDARITRSTTIAPGNRPANIPRHAAGLWTSVELGQGWSVGAGAFHVGERFALEDNLVRLPAYLRVDAMLGYQGKTWEAGLNLHNVGNRRYYESANNNMQIQPGSPRRATLFVRMKL